MMRNYIKPFLVVSIITASTFASHSQVTIEESNKYISIFYTQQYDPSTPEKAIREKGEKIGVFLPYIALKFSTGISDYKYQLSGLTSNSAFVMLDVDTSVFQEITDEFYALFTEKLSGLGIRVLSYEDIVNSKMYAEFSAQPITERNFSDVWTGESKIYTQKNAPIISLPKNPSPKMSKWMNPLKAAPSVLRLTIDFMEFEQVLENGSGFTSQSIANNSIISVIKIAGSSDHDNNLINFYEGGKTILNSDEAKVYDVSPGLMMGGYMNANLYFFNESIYQEYKNTGIVSLKDNNLPDWAVRLKNKYQTTYKNDSFEIIAIKVDREEYKKSALLALDKYTDYLLTVIKSYQK